MYKPFFRNIVYGGVDLSCYFDINKVTIAPFPDITLNTVQISGKAGSTYFSREIGERTIKLNLSLKASERNTLANYKEWRELTKLLLKSEPTPMKFDEAHYINVMALSASEITRLGYRGVSEVTFVAPDPYFYGKTQEAVLNPGDNSVWASGDVDAWPVIRLTNASNGLTVRNSNTGEEIVIPSGITSTASVVIDTELMRCTVNGQYVPTNLNRTDFFSLSPGQTTISLSSGTGTLTYKERYL